MLGALRREERECGRWGSVIYGGGGGRRDDGGEGGGAGGWGQTGSCLTSDLRRWKGA